MKIFISEFSQETNSFSPIITERKDFSNWTQKNSSGTRETQGMKDVFEHAGFDVVMGPLYRAQSSGPVMQSVVDDYISEVSQLIASDSGFDAICLAFHGATQSTKCDDVCGEIVTALKSRLNNDKLIAVSVDLHANITARFFQAADFISAYQTYPHCDLYDTGGRVAKMCVKALHGIKIHKARVEIPMIQPASGYTSSHGDFGNLVKKAKAMVKQRNLEDYSICMMQPWLDIPVGGSSVLVYALDKSEASLCATELAEDLVSLKDKMQPEVLSIEQIVGLVKNKKLTQPVIVSDFSDSPNAGATGDDVSIVKYLIQNNCGIHTAAIVNDKPAVDHAFKVGVGNIGKFRLGGTLDASYGDFIEIEGKVRSLHDGVFTLGGPILKGVEVDIGPSAVITSGKVDILVCYRMKITGDTQLYRHFGIEPSCYELVIVKANTSFRAVYGEISDSIVMCETNRAASANLKALPFKKLPRNFYPFSDLTDWNVKDYMEIY